MSTIAYTDRTPRDDRRGDLDLDALAAMDAGALGRLYAASRAIQQPLDVAALEGHPTGRMLAVRGLGDGALAGVLRRFAASRAFPWGGKTFRGRGDAGTGVNRVHLGGRHQLFPFVTRVATSAIDGGPCVVLDYDLHDNPGFIRAIHDEVREVERGLWLGPAMWKTGSGPTLVLWFALDTRVQAALIGTKEP